MEKRRKGEGEMKRKEKEKGASQVGFVGAPGGQADLREGRQMAGLAFDVEVPRSCHT